MSKDAMPDDCPEIRNKGGIDVDYYVCRINDKPCIMDDGHECEVYNDWIIEQAGETY